MSQILGCKCNCKKVTIQLIKNRCKDCNNSNHLNQKTGLRFQVGVTTRRRLQY